jgi:hypothetical protein
MAIDVPSNPKRSNLLSPEIIASETKNDQLIEEEIDPRILKLLNLSYEFDHTYDDYYTLLKEKSAAARMATTDISRDDIVLLNDELKRVKGIKDKSKKFKIKAKKIDPAKVTNRVAYPKENNVKINSIKLLPGSASTKNLKDISSSESKDCCAEISNFLTKDLLGVFKSINSSVKDILSILKSQLSADIKQDRQARIDEEKTKKRTREAELESREKTSKNIIPALVKPFSSFFDMIKNFFMNILMGGAIKFLLSVIKDPSIILTPLKNFANMVIKFLNDIIKFLWDFIVSPINFVIQAINDGIGSIINQINNAIRLIPGAKPISSPQIPTIPGPPQIPTFPVQQQEGGGEVINIGDILFDTGGQIKKNSGIKISGFGKDDRLIAAQEGEVMMSNKAGDFWGRDTLLAMNSMAGGSNRTVFGKTGIQAMAGGGQVGGQKIIFGAGHAPAMPGGTVGSDNKSVGGTTDPRTGVTESYAMSQLIKAMKSIVSSSPDVYKNIGFHDIKSYKGIREDTKRIEGGGNQFIELHLDQFGGGRSGVISRNRTPIDVALAAIYGFFPKDFKKGDLGVPDEGGTIVEIGAIDDKKLRPFMDEVKQGKIGSATQEIANTILTAVIGKSALKQSQTQISPPSTRPQVIVAPPVPMGGQQSRASGSSVQSQNSTPSFSSEDPMNINMMVIKSIYNMVG